MATNRREFIKVLTGGSLLCLGCGALCALPAAQKITGTPKTDKYQDDSRMSFERVFNFTYNEITLKLKLLADIMAVHIGREKFMEYLREAGAKSGEIDARGYAEKLGRTDLKSFTSELREEDYTVNHILTHDIIQDTDKVFEVRIKECLWARTFRQHQAEDIGHALFCNRDFTTASAFNPKIRLYRTQTLMQGHPFCNHRWVYEG